MKNKSPKKLQAEYAADGDELETFGAARDANLSRVPYPLSRVPYPLSRVPYPLSRVPYNLSLTKE